MYEEQLNQLSPEEKRKLFHAAKVIISVYIVPNVIGLLTSALLVYGVITVNFYIPREHFFEIRFYI